MSEQKIYSCSSQRSLRREGWLQRPALVMSLLAVIWITALNSSCASRPPAHPVTLELKAPETTRSFNYEYFTLTQLKTFEQSQLTREKTESGRFSVKTTYLASAPLQSEAPADLNSASVPALEALIHHRLRTKSQTGQLTLNDLGFPEVHEELTYTFSPQAEVLRVDHHPSSSHFYVPPIPLPQRQVSPGDTWEVSHGWVSPGGLPLILRVAAIFTNLVPCAGFGWCADLDISGDVEIPGVEPQQLAFQSLIQGRMLFAIEDGLLLWSEVHSWEEVLTAEEHQQTLSCLVGQITLDAQKCPTLECTPQTSIALPNCLIQ